MGRDVLDVEVQRFCFIIDIVRSEATATSILFLLMIWKYISILEVT